MTNNKDIVKALDGADVFLRNRANAQPAPLNEYDIQILLDIAKICDKSANVIRHQQEDIDKLKDECDRWHKEAELNANEIMKLQADIEKYEKIKKAEYFLAMLEKNAFQKAIYKMVGEQDAK